MEKNSKNQNQSMSAQSQQNTVQHNAYQDQRNPGQNQTYAGQYQPNAGQSQPYAGQYQPYAGQSQPYAGQNQPYAGQYQPNAGQNQPYAGQYQPNAGQSQLYAGQYQPNAVQNQQTQEQKQQKRKMSKIFQPKVIIGSVLGFIASAIGLIAVFFPSVFNQETKKIDDIVLSVNSENDAKKLYDTLKSHANKIVRLDITYDANNCMYDITSGINLIFTDTTDGDDKVFYKDEYIYKDEYGSIQTKTITLDDIENDKLIAKGIDINALKMKHVRHEDIVDMIGQYGFMPFGENELFSVISDYKQEMHGNYLYITPKGDF